MHNKSLYMLFDKVSAKIFCHFFQIESFITNKNWDFNK